METLHIIVFSLTIPFCCIVFYGVYKFLSHDISTLYIHEKNESLLPR
jgi:hypothetical protein